MKMTKKLLKTGSRFLEGIFLVFICLAAFAVLSSRIGGGEPSILGYQVKAVLSGSMEPTFQTGSIIIIKLGDQHSNYQIGDVVTFRLDGKLITHRIIEVERKNGQALYKTKGDNNDGPDHWTISAQKVVGKYTGMTIPYVGYALSYASSNWGSALLLIVPGILLIFSAIGSIMGAKKEMESREV